MDIGVPMTDDECVIISLLNNPFLKRSRVTQLEILTNGRPKPPLPELTKGYKSERNSKRNFHVKYYERYEWMTGSHIRNKLFCWPCLLFEKDSPGKSHWATTGVSNLKSLQKITYQHEISKAHYTNIISYTNFIQAGDDSEKLVKLDDAKICVVNLLLGYPFEDRPQTEQFEIFAAGRPTPPMPLLDAFDPLLKLKVGFHFKNYVKYKWLTGSCKLNKLFCWVCLLFADTSLHEPFVCTGFAQLELLPQEAEKHEASDIHNNNCHKYDTFKVTANKFQVKTECKTQNVFADNFFGEDEKGRDIEYEAMNSKLEEMTTPLVVMEENNIEEDDNDHLMDDDMGNEYLEEKAICLEHDQLEQYIEKQFENNEDSSCKIKYESNSCPCVIKDLLKTHFTKRSQSEQVEILQHGRPTPDMSRLSNVCNKYYHLFKWLTGSHEMNSFFCWCCLLLRDPLEQSLWSTEGFVDIRNIATRTRKHQSTKAHCNIVDEYKKLTDKLHITVENVENLVPSNSTTKLVVLNALLEEHKNENCIIVQMLRDKFTEKSLDEQRKIMENGRPTPMMHNLTTLVLKGTRGPRHFQKVYYERYKWLAGSRPLNRLFCWYCLLSSSRSSWATTGYADMQHFTDSIKIHDRSKEHKISELNFRKFGKTDEEFEHEIEQINKHKVMTNYLNENSKNCLINELLGYPFTDRSEDEQIQVLKNGRPMPLITARGERGLTKSLNANNYFKYKWLTASKKLQTLYCWYCLLFADTSCNSVWVQTGFRNMRKFSERAVKHQLSNLHKRNKLKYMKSLKQFQISDV